MESPAKGPKPGVLNTLPERIALARREGLDYADFLQIVLADEVSRRDHGRLELRLRQAGFERLCRLEDFDWSASIRLARRLLDAACSLRFLDRREHVLLALGAAERLGTASASWPPTSSEMAQARVDHSTEKAVPRLPRPELLILGDLGTLPRATKAGIPTRRHGRGRQAPWRRRAS